ncbi:MAG: DUF89 family protein [Phycisphaerales bacterium]|nr:DUF89 family protein [Phycisphaerales bacterium]
MSMTKERQLSMRSFCKLADADSYVACRWDLAVDEEARVYWIGFFKRHLEIILKLALEAADRRGESAGVRDRADRCREDFHAFFDSIPQRMSDGQRVTILTLDQWRDAILRRHGFVDAFVDLKNRENEKMLPLLPEVCRQIDALDGPEQLLAVVEGVFAGNIFDMGAEATTKKFLGDGPDFFAVRKSLAARPWLIDDFDSLCRRLLDGPVHRKAVFFIDNAGSDFLLGAIPMMRWLGRRGTRIVLAANERPTLNDMTIHDVRAWWGKIIEIEPSLKELDIQRVSTGTGEPLIDLSAVSDELNAASADADLVIIEGMGRGVESNLEARFSCDALKLAMIKDALVARRLEGKIFDVVCRFTRGI